MRMRKKPWAEAEISINRHVVKDAVLQSGRWCEIFGNENPIRVEIGMGKGKFIIEKALSDPASNYLGIERQLSVFAAAAKKIREQESGLKIENIRIAFADANLFSEMFTENEVDEIYINFCDPWPKKRYGKRRLTHRKYLDGYSGILKEGGKLIFKTDNRQLFDFTLNEFTETGWQVESVYKDLHKALERSPDIENITTEYEARFAELGTPIYKIAAINENRVLRLHGAGKNDILI